MTKRKTIAPYAVKYEVRDRFGNMVRVKKTFSNYAECEKFATRVYKTELKSLNESARLIKWGSNNFK